ncbi:TPA: hypothetical protein HA265_03395 [Candidatus Woesearchaeota archaeon]|nr:hypothetical protein [Candidatus Woesearchaeota archaeon]
MFRAKLEELLEEHFKLQPENNNPAITKGFERYHFGGWCYSDKIFEKARYYDEQGRKVTKKGAAERCTTEGYPLNQKTHHHVYSFVEALNYRVKGIQQLRVCRAFETKSVNVSLTEREYGHTIHSDTVVVKADFQQIPALHLEGRYVNPGFWRQYNRWNRKPLPTIMKRAHFEALINLYAEDQMTELADIARSYAMIHPPEKPHSNRAFFIDRGVSRMSMIPQHFESENYPEWYPDRQRQFRKKPVHYLLIGLLNRYQFKLLDERMNPEYPILHVHLRGPSAKKDDELIRKIALQDELRRIEESDKYSEDNKKRNQKRKEEIKALLER